MPAQSVTLGTRRDRGSEAQAWISPDGTVNLQQLFATTAPAAEPAPSGGNGTSDGGPPVDRRTWASVETRRTASIDFEDRMAEPAKKFALAPVNLRVDDASLDLARPLPGHARCADQRSRPLRGRRHADARTARSRAGRQAGEGAHADPAAVRAAGRRPDDQWRRARRHGQGAARSARRQAPGTELRRRRDDRRLSLRGQLAQGGPRQFRTPAPADAVVHDGARCASVSTACCCDSPMPA